VSLRTALSASIAVFASTALWLVLGSNSISLAVSEAAPVAVRADPRAPGQVARLGNLVISKNGYVGYFRIPQVMAQFPGASCRPTPLATRGQGEAIAIRPRSGGIAAFMGTIFPLDCQGGQVQGGRAAVLRLRITSRQVPVLTPLGALRIGARPPRALARLAVRRGASLDWPMADPCPPHEAGPAANYFMRASVAGGRVTSIDLRSGVLEIGECSPTG
jgi:hypothetical protein